MIATVAVGKNQLLLCYVYGIHEVLINNQAPAQAYEAIAGIAKLVSDKILYLTQLKGNDLLPVVLSDNIGVIPVRRYVN